jgi:hypothetical protein
LLINKRNIKRLIETTRTIYELKRVHTMSELNWHINIFYNSVCGYKTKVGDSNLFITMLINIGIITKCSNGTYIITKHILYEGLNSKLIDKLLIKEVKIHDYIRHIKIKKIKKNLKWYYR